MDTVKIGQNLSKLYEGSFPDNNKLNAEKSNSFGKMFSDSLQEVESAHKESEKMIQGFASGRNTDIHNTMIAMEKADISFQLMMQIRNKLVSAYQEIYRMQI